MRVLPTFSNGEFHYVTVEEKPSGFYDDFYRRERMYSLPACESSVYRVWEKVAGKVGDGERVLDLGCGTGQFAQVLLNKGKRFALGIDFSPVAIEKAKSLLPFSRFVVGDLYRASTYEGLDYDCVTMIEVVEHLEHDLAVFGHIKEGAHIVFTAPNYITQEGSHVRGFRNEGEIIERYDRFVRFIGMEEMGMDGIQKLWVVNGMKRA